MSSMLGQQKVWWWWCQVAAVILIAGAGKMTGGETNMFWLVEQVPPTSLTGATFAGQPQATARALVTEKLFLEPIFLTPRQSGWGQRWAKFETDYGIQQVNPSAMLGAIESAKYAVDWTTLTMQEWLDSVKTKLSFRYELRNLTRATPATTPAQQIRGNPWRDAWENARFQSDIDLRLTGRAFLGVKLVLPIGD